MSCEACDERAKKIDEMIYTIKALKVDIAGRSEITLLLQQKYEAEFHLCREVGGQLAIAVLQVKELQDELAFSKDVEKKADELLHTAHLQNDEARKLLQRFLDAGPEEEYEVILCKLSGDVEAFLSGKTLKPLQEPPRIVVAKTIDELEAVLNRPEPSDIEVNPDGTVTKKSVGLARICTCTGQGHTDECELAHKRKEPCPKCGFVGCEESCQVPGQVVKRNHESVREAAERLGMKIVPTPKTCPQCGETIDCFGCACAASGA